MSDLMKDEFFMRRAIELARGAAVFQAGPGTRITLRTPTRGRAAAVLVLRGAGGHTFARLHPSVSHWSTPLSDSLPHKTKMTALESEHHSCP